MKVSKMNYIDKLGSKQETALPKPQQVYKIQVDFFLYHGSVVARRTLYLRSFYLNPWRSQTQSL